MIRDERSALSEPLDRRKFVLGGAFIGAVALAFSRMPRTVEDFLGKRKLDDIIPKHIGPWAFVTASGLVTAPEDQLSRLIYSQMVTRVYAADEMPSIMMLVAQSASQTGVVQIHRPEVCYPASGYSLSPVIEQDIAVAGGRLRTNRLSATMNGVTEHIIYWTRIGTHMPVSWAQQRLAVAGDNLDGIIPDAVLARISLVLPDRDAAMQYIETFTRELVSALPASARKVLMAGL